MDKPIVEEMRPGIGSFLNFYNKRGTRQQRGITGMGRLHQNLVPEMHKKDPSLNQKVEQVRGRNDVRKKVLNATDLGYITTKYNIKNVDKEHPRKLGKTGITLYYDASVQGWCLSRT